MKLAALYTVYNGLELLESSIKQIYPLVDNVVISYQAISNKGHENHEVEPFMKRFAGWDKVKIIKFIPDLALNTKENERKKHQLLIDFAKFLKSDYFFLSATDHFYKRIEFASAAKYVIRGCFDVSFTKMYTYYKHPNWQLSPIEDYCMPFVCKLYPNTEIVRPANYPVRVDPSVQVNTCDTWHLFSQDFIMMHHYSMIRQNIHDKFKNAAASIRWKPADIERFIAEYENAKPGDKISYFQGREIIDIGNQATLISF